MFDSLPGIEDCADEILDSLPPTESWAKRLSKQKQMLVQRARQSTKPRDKPDHRYSFCIASASPASMSSLEGNGTALYSNTNAEAVSPVTCQHRIQQYLQSQDVPPPARVKIFSADTSLTLSSLKCHQVPSSGPTLPFLSFGPVFLTYEV